MMPVLHHNVQILDVPDAAARVRLHHLAHVRRALIVQLDERHWLLHAREVPQVLKLCARAGITVTVHSHGQ